MTSDRPTIGYIVGSLSRFSINRTLAEALVSLIGERATTTEVEIGLLPMFNRDLESDLPQPVRQFKTRLGGLDGLLIITPEHNRTIPAVLKNALEWGSRPYGTNSFAGIATGVVGASPGALGTALAQQHLRNILANLDAPTLAQPELFFRFAPEHSTVTHLLSDPVVTELLANWTDRFLGHVDLHVRLNSTAKR